MAIQDPSPDLDRGAASGRLRDIFMTFLALGCTSFGGPVAHLGYFRTAFVERRKWIGDAAFADLVALCQFLPGPASSQVGFAIGLMRGGWLGALAAFTAFTLPSALLLVAFAYGAATLTDPVSLGVLAGLKLLAVAVVADAVWGMGTKLCPDRPRLAIALAGVVLLGLWSGPAGQVAVILAGGLAGLVWSLAPDAASDAAAHTPIANAPSARTGLVLIVVAGGLLVLLPALALAGVGGQSLALFDAFYRAGALVFGGGHVVLPLLEEAVVGPGWVDPDTFLAGYGAAQAVPGPLFTFAAFLGAAADPQPNGLSGAAVALVAIFLPGFLLLAGALPWWDRLRAWPAARSVMAGVNAAVVGVLAAALYDPVFTSGVQSTLDLAVAACAFFALQTWKAPVWTVVLAMAVLGGLRGLTGI
jgi:chromate transporter